MEDNLKNLLEERKGLETRLSTETKDLEARMSRVDVQLARDLEQIDETYNMNLSSDAVNALAQRKEVENLKEEYKQRAENEKQNLQTRVEDLKKDIQEQIENANRQIGLQLREVRDALMRSIPNTENQIEQGTKKLEEAQAKFKEAEKEYENEKFSLYHQGIFTSPDDTKMLEAQRELDEVRQSVDIEGLKQQLRQNQNRIENINQFFGKIMIKETSVDDIEKMVFGDFEPLKEEKTEPVEEREEQPEPAEAVVKEEPEQTAPAPESEPVFEKTPVQEPEPEQIVTPEPTPEVTAEEQSAPEQEQSEPTQIPAPRQLQRPVKQSKPAPRAQSQEASIQELQEEILGRVKQATKQEPTAQSNNQPTLDGLKLGKVEVDVSTGDIKITFLDKDNKPMKTNSYDLVAKTGRAKSPKQISKELNKKGIDLIEKVDDPYIIKAIVSTIDVLQGTEQYKNEESIEEIKNNVIDQYREAIDLEEEMDLLKEYSEIKYIKSEAETPAKAGILKTLEKAIAPYARYAQYSPCVSIDENIDTRTFFEKAGDFVTNMFSGFSRKGIEAGKEKQHEARDTKPEQEESFEQPLEPVEKEPIATSKIKQTDFSRKLREEVSQERKEYLEKLDMSSKDNLENRVEESYFKGKDINAWSSYMDKTFERNAIRDERAEKAESEAKEAPDFEDK